MSGHDDAWTKWKVQTIGPQSANVVTDDHLEDAICLVYDPDDAPMLAASRELYAMLEQIHDDNYCSACSFKTTCAVLALLQKASGT